MFAQTNQIKAKTKKKREKWAEDHASANKAWFLGENCRFQVRFSKGAFSRTTCSPSIWPDLSTQSVRLNSGRTWSVERVTVKFCRSLGKNVRSNVRRTCSSVKLGLKIIWVVAREIHKWGSERIASFVYIQEKPCNFPKTGQRKKISQIDDYLKSSFKR